ncbi:protein of unknown function [Methanocaldococcus lauensis]|nr:protein of unknown function [Methanocaldococcus lauensis]
MTDVCGIIVTYEERGPLLEKVVNRLIEEGVSKVIIVDNNSGNKSKQIMKDLVNKHSDKIRIIHLKESIESAGGFKMGLQAFLKENCKFAWLLEDDNVPEKGALDKLVKYNNDLSKNTQRL